MSATSAVSGKSLNNYEIIVVNSELTTISKLIVVSNKQQLVISQ